VPLATNTKAYLGFGVYMWPVLKVPPDQRRGRQTDLVRRSSVYGTVPTLGIQHQDTDRSPQEKLGQFSSSKRIR
jgi:hypothetical protein